MSCLVAPYSCVMNTHKKDLSRVSTRTLLDRRRRLVTRLGEAETLLAGSLVEQTRRCGKAGCRCAEGEPHGPYVYFAPKTAGRGRLRYVPAALVEVVRRCVQTGAEVEAVLAEISTINTELLARRELR